MCHRHHRPPGEQPGEHHGPRARRVHRLTGGAGQIDAPAQDWHPGHRGVDLAGTAGQPVYAAAVEKAPAEWV
ncbi:hypothetical protein MAHJHV50_49450 [Mycobacterium avium subsp. hominissuis]